MSTLSVGLNGQQFRTIAAAVAASQDGDVIQIQAGTYVNDFAEITKKITIQGVGGMAKLVATQQIPNGKAILITDTDVTIDHLEFSGATVGDGNGAGIRYQGGNLVITNSSFHGNQNGLLAADDLNGSITIKGSDFYGNGVGGDGHTHNLYVGDIRQLIVDSSYFHGAIIGHEIKSRAESTIITNSRIQDEPGGTSSYEIDLPNGGNAIISNNVIEQSAASQNAVIISYGEEGNLRANSSLIVSGNTILNDQSLASDIAVRNATTVAAIVSNNKVFGLTAAQILSGPGTISGLTIMSIEPVLNTLTAILSSVTAPVTTPAPTPSPTTITPVSPNPTAGLVLDISEDAWQGDALYTISVDGQQIGGTLTASASHSAFKTQPILVSTALAPGQHTVTVNFLNDAFGGSASTDRNLYVDTALLNGQTIAGSTLTLLSQGPQSFTMTVPAAATTTPTPAPPATATTGLVVKISEDAWQGDAQYTIKVDGQQIGGTLTASASHAAGLTQSIAVNTLLSAGRHTVAVTFLNDAYGGTPTTDRNLYVDSATINGQTIAGSTITMLSAGTSSFDFTVAAAAAPPATSALVLRMSEDAWLGDAQYTVAVDGQQQGGTLTATALHGLGQSQAMQFNPVLAAGTHTVSINFLNDAYAGTPTTDRNLYLDSATLNGASLPGSTITMLSQGTYTFNLVVPTS